MEGDAAALVLASLAILKLAEASEGGTHERAVEWVRATQQATECGPLGSHVGAHSKTGRATY